MLHKIGYEGNVADNAFRSFCEKYGFATPAEKEALASVFSLYGGYISDVDGVENRDGTIPGYGVKENNENQFVTVFKKIVSKLLELLEKAIIFGGRFLAV